MTRADRSAASADPGDAGTVVVVEMKDARARAAHPSLGLGTANWGTTYGAPGREVQVDAVTAATLARQFLAAGHDLVDTAPSYGEAEVLVGQAFAAAPRRVVTKVPSAALAAPPGERAQRAVDSVARSARVIGVDRFEGVLLHDPSAALVDVASSRAVLSRIRESGLAARVGVSVYSVEEAHAAVDRLGADFLQVPCNVLDQRFLAGDGISGFAVRGVEVHMRSVFLNGTLLADPGQLTGPLERLAPAVARLRREAAHWGLTPLEAAVGFAREATGAAAVVVGAFTAEQLREVLDAWERPTGDARVDWASLAFVDGVADPRTWRR